LTHEWTLNVINRRLALSSNKLKSGSSEAHSLRACRFSSFSAKCRELQRQQSADSVENSRRFLQQKSTRLRLKSLILAEDFALRLRVAARRKGVFGDQYEGSLDRPTFSTESTTKSGHSQVFLKRVATQLIATLLQENDKNYARLI
jgi:hypothetical protein